MHYKRTLATALLEVAAAFPAVLLTGPRQVGKTTLLLECMPDNYRYVTLDDFAARNLAQNDPELFFQTYPPPVIIDEVQYAPNLFSTIKQIVDREKKPGLFLLTGSQKFHLMSGISETLSGRMAILDLLGLSQAEIANRAAESQPFLPTPEWIANASKAENNSTDINKVYQAIWHGSFPKNVTNSASLRDIFYNSYIQTYIERDVRALAKVIDEMSFNRFLRVAAARTAQLINYADMARDVEVDVKTIKSWLGVLEASGLIFLLYPFHNNVTNRLIKTPKLYFLDTGLCTHLTRWTSAEALQNGAMSGAILETYLMSEIIKSYWHNAQKPILYFYRDRDGKEIDLLIEQNGQLYPIEFKKSASPNLSATKNFSALNRLPLPIGRGSIVCFRPEAIPLSREISSIPIGYL